MSIFGTRTYNPKTGRTVTTTGNRIDSIDTQTATPKYNPPKYGPNKRQGGPHGNYKVILPGDPRYADHIAKLKAMPNQYGQNKKGRNSVPAPTQTAPVPSTQGGQGQEAYNYIKELQKSPGMTPEQTQLLRNRISDTHASQRQGSEERLRGQMARSGLAGSGQETKGLLANEASNMSSLQNALTSQDLANMQMENQNKMTLAGLGVQASGQNDRNAFNYAQLAQQGGQYQQNFGWQQHLNELNQYYYNQQQGQWNDWLNQLM